MHKRKLESNVPTSDSQHPISATAITLVALIITIIVLLILAGVTLAMVIGENGIFNKANEAKEKTNIANIKEQIQMEIANKQTLNRGNITDGELEDILKKYGTIKYEGEKIKGITTKEGNYEIAIKDIYNGKTTPEVKKLATQVITPKNYGDEVEYSANGVNSWKVFLNDGTNIYIIASEYLKRDKMTLDTSKVEAGDGEYCVKGTSRDNLISWLKDTTKWTAYANGTSGLTGTVTGGPMLDQFWLSYNNKHATSYSGDQNLSSHKGYDDELYFPHKEGWNGCNAYWLSTPYADDDICVWRIYFNATVSASGYGYRATACRGSSISMSPIKHICN